MLVLRERLAAVGRALTVIVGASDYGVYLAHHKRMHPDREPPSRAEFDSERLKRRYGAAGPGRCC